MKKKVFFLLLLCCATHVLADKLYIEPFSIAYGETKQIAINLEMKDATYRAVQFDLYLPEGLSIAKNAKGRYIWSLNEDRIDEHTIAGNLKEGGYFTFGIYSTADGAVFWEEDGPLMYIKVTALDNISTGQIQLSIRNQNLAISSTESTFPNDVNTVVTSSITTTVTTLGYASFSWPKALDFTNSGLTAYIATSCNNNSIHLEPVTKVPANTGLILKGTAGSENTYPLQTTDDTTLDDVSENMLTSNATGVYEVTTNNVYVLSNLDNGKPGFYLANQGIHVGQYKSYLVLSSGSRQGLVFDEGTTGINGDAIQEQPADNHIYNLNGQRLQTSTVGSGKQVTLPQKGIYIMNGKKYIVK